jgi:hypothetical protein
MGEAKRNRTQELADVEALNEFFDSAIMPMTVRMAEAFADAINTCEAWEKANNPKYSRELFDKAMFCAMGKVLATFAETSARANHRA